MVGLVLAACGGGAEPNDLTPDAGTPSNPAAPRFLSFGTNVGSITEDESIVFTAVLTDPDGIDDLIGGSLTSADGAIHYGAFATSGQEGSYTISLSWAAIQQAQDISFRTMEQREFRAEFFDVAGHAVERRVTIALTCGGRFACSGTCANACGVNFPQRVSCDAACAQHEATCMTNDTDRRAFYREGGQQSFTILDTCAEMPAATHNGLPFYLVECLCAPME